MRNFFRLLHFMETFFALSIVSTGDVAYGARQYVSLTRDVNWLNNAKDINKKTGYDLLLETARFWASRATPNKQNKFDINGKSLKNISFYFSVSLAKHLHVHFVEVTMFFFPLQFQQ